MTRTERATYPRALNRDRSESKSGLDTSIRKGGAGNHNWGSLADEQSLEDTSLDDDDAEVATEASSNQAVHPRQAVEPSQVTPMERTNSSGSTTDEDREKARQLRKNAFKKGEQIDLAAIARTSAAVTGSPHRAENNNSLSG